MTDQELANQLFPQEHHGSNAAASLLTGTALEASSNGQVLILVDGATGGSVDAGVLLPTTLSVAAGESVIITLYGAEGHGKKAIVTGRVGESSGGDPTLPGRVATLESKTNEIVDLVNRRGYVRLYSWTGTGALASCTASFWYNRLTGEVIVPVRVAGTPGSGWHGIGSGVPATLRPGALASTPYPDTAQVLVTQNTSIYASSSGGVGFYTSYGGNMNDQGYICYLVNADLNYSSTISTVTSSIQPITISRAYAARVALGDGLDVTSEEFEKTARFYNEAYDVIFPSDEEER